MAHHLVQICLFMTVGIAWSTGQATSSNNNNFFYISAKGNELWAIDRQYVVNRYVNGTWVKLTTGIPAGYKPISVGASPDGWSWMVLDAGNLWRWNPDQAKWELQGGAGGLQVNAISKLSAMTVTTGGQVWEISPTSSTTWASAQITDAPLSKWVSIGENGERWLIDTKGMIFRRNNTTKKYEPFPGLNAVNLDAQSSDRVIVTTQCCWVYMLNGDSWSRQDVPGCTKQATITHNNAYYLDEMQNFGGATFETKSEK